MKDPKNRSPSGRRRRTLILVAVCCLLLTLSLGMLGGTRPQRWRNSWFPRPGGRHRDRPVPPGEDEDSATWAAADAENGTCDACCYRYATIQDGTLEIRSEAELRERGCAKRLPDALIAGVRKAGTGTLRSFLSYHPDIAFAQKELHFFTATKNRRKGMEFYRKEMMYSTPGQVSMEKTTSYSYFPEVPAMIKQVLPDVKLIIIMRDPVKRAISDFVQMQVIIEKNCNKTSTCKWNTGYHIADTFEDSIIDSNGEIDYSNLLIAKGLYVTEIQRCLKYFDPDQILALDGETFIKNPYTTVKLVEKFLGIRDYFARDHFYFDDQKGFFCLNKPFAKNCMKQVKGRPHPDVSDEALRMLRDYYRPYNEALKELTGVDFR